MIKLESIYFSDCQILGMRDIREKMSQKYISQIRKPGEKIEKLKFNFSLERVKVKITDLLPKFPARKKKSFIKVLTWSRFVD